MSSIIDFIASQQVDDDELLTREEEIELSRLVLAAIALDPDCQAHLEKVNPHALTTAPEAMITWRRGVAAKQKLIRYNTRLVMKIAKSFVDRGLDYEELIQEGTLGLGRAVEKFDPTKGYRFSTYATWWIRQAIVRGLHGQSRTIRLPIHMHEKFASLKRVARKQFEKTGQALSLSDIANASETPLEKVRSLAENFRPIDSLDRTIGSGGKRYDDGATLFEFVSDADSDPLAIAEKSELISMLRAAVNKLEPKQRRVIILRFLGEEPHTLKETATAIEMSYESVRLIQDRAIRNIRKLMQIQSV